MRIDKKQNSRANPNQGTWANAQLLRPLSILSIMRELGQTWEVTGFAARRWDNACQARGRQNVYASIPLHKFKIKEANSGRNSSIDIIENAECAFSIFMAVIHYSLRKSMQEFGGALQIKVL